MAKTLADMTPEERADCVGMWCDNLVSTADSPKPVVLACVQGDRCWILHTDLHGEWSCFPLGSVSPRPDLPRAWTPDGEPEIAQALAEEAWEYTQEIYFDGKWQPIYEDLWFETPEECDGLWLDIEPWKWNNEPLRIVRRRVSPPEVINE